MLRMKSTEPRRFSNGPEKAQVGCWQEEKKIESSVEAKETRRQGTKEQTAVAQRGREN
jgi:hypothetical protein